MVYFQTLTITRFPPPFLLGSAKLWNFFLLIIPSLSFSFRYITVIHNLSAYSFFFLSLSLSRVPLHLSKKNNEEGGKKKSFLFSLGGLGLALASFALSQH